MQETNDKADDKIHFGGYIGTNIRCFVCGRHMDEINQIIQNNLGRKDVEALPYDPLCDMAVPLDLFNSKGEGRGTVYFRIALCQVCEKLFHLQMERRKKEV